MASSSHVVLPPEALARSPSREDGVTEDVETSHRFWGCEVIEEAGILLRLPQVVMVTAQTMLHRFYYRKSLRDFDAFRVAIGCLFLAAKVEEQPKRIKDVLSVFYAIYRRRKWRKTTLSAQLLDLESESYDLWRDWLIMVERQILIDLGFSLYNIMEHPHKYILYYIKILDGTQALAQRAWGYLNDSLRIDLCVRFHAEAIACAAIFLAARQLQVKLPDDPAWYELFHVDRESLETVSRAILALYKREKIEWLDALTKVDPFAIDDLPDVESVHLSSKDKEEEPGKDELAPQADVARSEPQSANNTDQETEGKAHKQETNLGNAIETVSPVATGVEAATVNADRVGPTDDAAAVAVTIDRRADAIDASAVAIAGTGVGAARAGVRNIVKNLTWNDGIVFPFSNMEPQTELDAALIDAFDADAAPPCALRMDDAVVRRKSPIVSEFRGLYSAQTARATPVESTLRHYPSLDALGPPATSPMRPVMTAEARQASCPRFEPLQPAQQQMPKEKTDESISVPNRTSEAASATPPLHSEEPEAPPVRPTTEFTSDVTGSGNVQTEPATLPMAPQVPDRIPTDEEIEIQRRQLELEVNRFEQQASYMALALAGETPHQIGMRRVREQERQEREERRLAAVEARLEHVIERERQREARQMERRERLMERTHRSSISPSPERGAAAEENDEQEGDQTVKSE